MDYNSKMDFDSKFKFEEPKFIAAGSTAPGIKIEFPLEVVYDDDLPNGIYHTGGPVGPTINKITSYVKPYTTGYDLMVAMHNEILKRMADSFVSKTTTTGPLSANMNVQKMDTNLVDPNTIEAEQMQMGMKMIITATVHIAINYKGSQINIDDTVKEGEGYQVTVYQDIKMKAGPAAGCCIIQ